MTAAAPPLRRLGWALPACAASGLTAFLPVTTRPEPVAWVVGTAVLAGVGCLAAGRRARVVGVAALAVALGMLVQLRLGVPPGRSALVGLAASLLLVAGVRVGGADRVAVVLEDLYRRRLGALVALGAAVALRAVTVLGPSPAAGTLPLVPVQIGELTRYLLAGGAALVLAEPAPAPGAAGWAGVDRRYRLAAGALVVAGVGTLVALRDLGPAVVVVAGLLAGCMHTRGVRARWVVTGVLAAAAAVPVVWSASVVRTRVHDVVDPGHQLAAALGAAWSGGLVGPGPGRNPLVTGVPAIGSDYALVALVADLGALVVTPVLLVLLATEIHLVRVAGARRGAANTLAVTLAAMLAVQGCWNALGVVGVLPLTGLDQPFVGASGASLCTSALVLGLVLGVLGRPADPRPSAGAVPIARFAGAGARTVAVLLVGASLLLAVGPRTIGDAEQLRLPRGTVWTADGRVVSADSPAGRDYPSGTLYTDLGYERWNDTHRGLDAVEADTLTCGGRLGPADLLAGLFHPVCRPADVVTTLDSRVQAAAASAVRGRTAEVVVLDARTGAVLAVQSSPATAPGAPSSARERQGPPGSTMKLVTAAAALLAGVDFGQAPREAFRGADGALLRNDDGATCPGSDPATALADSCNSVYGWSATRVGAAELARVARTYFGADTPFRLDGVAAAGLDTGLRDTAPGAVTDGPLARTGIGQESVRSSVLGIALATAVAAGAGDGPVRWPHLVAAVCAGDGPVAPEPAPAVGPELPPSVTGPILAGMHGAVDGGTARRLVVPAGRNVAAKTGTAQLPGDRVDSWVTTVVDHRYVLTLVVHDPVTGTDALDAASRVLPAVPRSTDVPTCPDTPASKESDP